MKLKLILILGLVLSFSYNLIAQGNSDMDSQQMVFQTNGWKKAVKEAKVENKYIFIQLVIDDCTPCSKVKKEAWRDAKVKSIYSKSFILFSPDEGSPDADHLDEIYTINTYPTSIFVDAKGKVIHKYLGYVSPEIMIDMSEKVLKKKYTLSYFDNLYKNEGGRMDPNLLFEYALTLMNAGRSYELIAKSYFKNQPTEELLSEQNLKAMMLFTDRMDSREFRYLVRGRSNCNSAVYSEQQIGMKIESVISNSLMASMEESKKIVLSDTLEGVFNYFEIRDQEGITSRVEMDYYDYIDKSRTLYFEALNRYMMSHLGILSSAFVVDKASRVIAESKNMEDFDNAIMWINESMMNEDGESEDAFVILIKLLNMVNRQEEAKDVAERLKMKWIESGTSEEEATIKYDKLMESMEHDKDFSTDGDEGEIMIPNR